MRSRFLPEDAFESMVEAAVARAVSSEDLDAFIAWLQHEVFARSLDLGEPLPPQGAKSLATLLGRAIWGATPAPHNDFRPKALPAPGRNDPCVCGSGLKFKRCCGSGPALPSIRSAELWPFVLDSLKARDRERAVASGNVPIESLIMAAGRADDEGRYKFAVSLLEPLFGEKFAGVGEDYDYALTLLCNLYDALGYERKKIRLLDRVTAEAPRSPLRSGAYQRLAAIALDNGDAREAWAAFREAQRDAPDSPHIGLLEVQLLLGENRPDEARERARFWRRRLQRMHVEELDGAIEFLTSIIDDPYATLADVGIQSTGGAGDRLREAIRDLGERPLPQYELVDASQLEESSEDLETQIARRLSRMGVPKEQIGELGAELLKQMQDLPLPDDPGSDVGEEHEEEGDEFENHFRLVPPAGLHVVEQDWHAVYPVGKPFSVQDYPSGDVDPWEPDVEDGWAGFAGRHPECFDSIDILDDLATAVAVHPGSHALGLMRALQQPLVERAVGILRNALAAAAPGRASLLPWYDTENRPVLRCLFRAHMLAAEHGELDLARAHAELLLQVDPGDSHGVRASLMNILLRMDEDEEALALAARFPDDMLPDIVYGQVLALVRLGLDAEAAQAAQSAADALPEVRRYLMRERARQPELSPMGVTLGGKDQAWIYRQEMRDVWLATPEAMALIRKRRPK